MSERIWKWLKAFAARAYSRAVYCRTCGYEIGNNPECAECIRKVTPLFSRR